MPFWKTTKNVLQFTWRRRTVDSAKEKVKGRADGSIHELGPRKEKNIIFHLPSVEWSVRVHVCCHLPAFLIGVYSPLSTNYLQRNIQYRDELNIDAGKLVLACFYTRNYFEWIIKQLLNSAFVGYEEFLWSRRVLSTEAEHPPRSAEFFKSHSASFNNC